MTEQMLKLRCQYCGEEDIAHILAHSFLLFLRRELRQEV